METKKSKAYLRAKKKVKILKGFYSHLTFFIVINTILILVNAGLFESGELDFIGLGNYFTTIMWGIGLLSHAIFVFFALRCNTNFFKDWEEKKINEILKQQDEEFRKTGDWR